MTRHTFLLTAAALTVATTASAQEIVFHPRASTHVEHFVLGGAAQQFEFVAAEPLEHEGIVTNAPFSAEAVNEFTQTLADGNRIERRYTTSLWRDSQGRTRRDQQVALVGRLNVDGDPPRLVTINDPVAEASYTLDERTKTAHKTSHYFVFQKHAPEGVGAGVATVTRRAVRSATEDVLVVRQEAVVHAPETTDNIVGSAQAGNSKVENLGTQMIEGIAAEGTRTTMTLPAGAIGNIAPIEVVSERWFSKELQTAVMITRRDPQAGDTVYRLTNISRGEPSADLFAVPSDYKVLGATR
jgi:hypothetical protein